MKEMTDLRREWHCTACGAVHRAAFDRVLYGRGALAALPQLLADYGARRVFLLADRNTERVGGEAVRAALTRAGVEARQFVFEEDAVEPDERAVGAAVMHFDTSCDLIIGIGSGVINDIGKLLSTLTARPYFIVATAPSMDGYASATSSMARDGLKVSLKSRCPDVILGDTALLATAPDRMLFAGLGDMLAKYVSICEWRIAHTVLGEPYCEEIADLVRRSLAACGENADGLLRREDAAIEAVFAGLVRSGIAMSYAGVSRPASGGEHYMSHIWDMRGLAFGTPVALHGTQCAIATLATIKGYEALAKLCPDRERALAFIEGFDFAAWTEELRRFVGPGAEAMIAQEQREKKYDKALHKARLEKIIASWEQILCVIREELPSSEMIDELLCRIGAPRSCEEIGIDRGLLPMTFLCAKDIRDKYVLPRLAFDLGLGEEIANAI